MAAIEADVAENAQAALDRHFGGVGGLADHQATEVGHVLDGQRTCAIVGTGGTCAHPVGAADGAIDVEGVTKAVVERLDGQHAGGVHLGAHAGREQAAEVDAVAHEGDIAAAGIDDDITAGGVDVPVGCASGHIGFACRVEVTATGVEGALQVHAIPVGSVGTHGRASAHCQAIPGGAGVGGRAAIAAQPDVAAIGGERRVVVKAHPPVEGRVGIGPENHVQLAGAGAAGDDAGVGVQALVGLERERRVAATGLVDGSIDVDCARRVAVTLQVNIPRAGDGQGCVHIDRAAVGRDRSRHRHGGGRHLTTAPDVDRSPRVGGLADRQAGHGLAVLVPVEPLGVDVLREGVGRRGPQHIATGAHLRCRAVEVVAVEPHGQATVAGVTSITSCADPVLGPRVGQPEVGTTATAQQVQRTAVGDQVGAVANEHRPFVAAAVQRDAPASTAGDELLVAHPVATLVVGAQVNTMVPACTGGGVAAFDDDGVCTGIGRADVYRAVRGHTGLDRPVTVIARDAFDVNLAGAAVDGGLATPRADAPGRPTFGRSPRKALAAQVDVTTTRAQHKAIPHPNAFSIART